MSNKGKDPKSGGDFNGPGEEKKNGDVPFEKLWFGAGRTVLTALGLEGEDLSIGLEKRTKRYRGSSGEDMTPEEFVHDVVGGKSVRLLGPRDAVEEAKRPRGGRADRDDVGKE